MPAKKPHERVMEFVEKELNKDPNLRSAELYKRAKSVSRMVSNMSVRQFHARYPLVVKRRQAAANPGRRKAASKPRRTVRAASSNRDAIRNELLAFAQDLAKADTQEATIRVMSGLEDRIDRIVKARG
ncbi:MAG: hypothetical protein MJB57_16220 [Gemmatimonadetes bacterium]|nr:hypothetical protein [Gemmatimonadota bacterium]